MPKFVYKIKKLAVYLKYIWLVDQDWDSAYLLELILIKIKFMITAFENGMCECSDKNALLLRELYALGNIILDDKYGEGCLDVEFWNKLNEAERTSYFYHQAELKRRDIDTFFSEIARNYTNLWD